MVAVIVRATPAHLAGWMRLRQALWPEPDVALHEAACRPMLGGADVAAFVALADGEVVGFAEAALRHDYVNGCDTSPVAFLEGIYIDPVRRGTGLGRALAQAVADWALALGVQELASDAELGNRASHAFHRALGFAETERVVYFRRALTPSPSASPPPLPAARPR